MGKYKFLLFDMDDTLFDFQATQEVGFRFVLEQYKIPYTDEIFATYKHINHGLWRAYERGEIRKSEVFTRYTKTMQALQIPADGAEMERLYQRQLANGTQLKADAEIICQKFATEYEMYIVTNGIASTQEKRLADTGLGKYFKEVFISEYIGALKPSKEFFSYVANHIPNFVKEDALIIGDSVACDIVGGKKARIDTCWIKNPHAEDSEVESTYIITELYELIDIVQ